MRKEFRLFIPEELHADIKEKAWEEKKSMNQYILDCVAKVEIGKQIASEMDSDILKIAEEFAGQIVNHETPTEECPKCHDTYVDLPNHTCRAEEKPEIPKETTVLYEGSTKIEIAGSDEMNGVVKKKCKSCKTKTSNFVIRKGKEIYVCDKHIKNV